MIKLVPAVTPVTTPVLLIDAIAGVPDTHGLIAAGVPEPVKAVVAPIHALNVPVTVGSGFTVSTCVALLPLLSV